MSRGTPHQGSRGALRGLLEEALAVPGQRLPTPEILDALPAAGEPRLDDPVQMRLYVHGPLAEAVTTVLGRPYADRLVDHYELTRGLAEEADAPQAVAETNAGTIAVISPSYSLRDRLENLLDVEGFITFSGADTAEAIALCKAESIALVLIDEDAPEPLYEDPHRAMRGALGSRMPATVLLVGDDAHRDRPTCPTLAKALDPIEVLEVVHALATPDPIEPASAGSSTTARGWAGQSPYAPLVYEALELVAAPEVRDRLLREALAAANLDAVPTDRTLFAQFVTGALHRAIAQALGEDDADAVVLDLQSTSGIHQRAVIMANKQPSSIPPPEARELEATTEDDEPSGIHRPGLSVSEVPTAIADDDADSLIDALSLDAPERRPSPLPNDSPSHVRGRAVRVLLADDDETLLGMLERTLDAAGFEVATSTNGRDALSLCLRYEPTVLVADMHMPVLNGRDVAQLLKRMRDDRAPATILLTADPTVPRLIEGVAEVLGKPIRARRLIEAIERAAGSATQHVG